MWKRLNDMLNTNVKPLKVAYRGGFSDREGIKAENTDMQLEALDERTRVAIANCTNGIINDIFERLIHNFEIEHRLFLNLLSDVYCQVVDYSDRSMKGGKDEVIIVVTKTIIEGSYDEVFTVIEYVSAQLDGILELAYEHPDIYSHYNDIFEREYVGYRFINGLIAPITDKEEIREIGNALQRPYSNVHKHIEKALYHISNRDKPDYENSIKESISAVEAICCNITNKDKATLGDALKLIKKNGEDIHPALAEAFNKMYGYTSDDESGIRHSAGLGGKDSTFAEARYMLVACSAFINYLEMTVLT